MTRLASFGVAALLLVVVQPAHASTAAFVGDVTAVDPFPPNHKDGVAKFTVKINYYDYCSWGKFGRDSKVGESITRQVKKIGSVCMINGELTNAATFAAAIRPGQWGYFYEDTWLDLQTTPDFQWGEVIKHDVANKQFTLRVHKTHKDHHLAANPPKDVTIQYGEETTFRIENTTSAAAAAIKPGHWVQIHKPRPQILLVRDKTSKYDPSQWQPVADGKRGFANDLTAPAIIKGFKTKTPTGVIDQSVELTVSRKLNNKWADAALNCRKVSFVLDGKLAPVQIGAKAGRRAVLGHYRKEKTPHKVFVRSKDDAIRGWITEVWINETTRLFGLSIQTREDKPRKFRIDLIKGAVTQRNGQVVAPPKALLTGADVTLHPARGRTIIAFTPN